MCNWVSVEKNSNNKRLKKKKKTRKPLCLCDSNWPLEEPPESDERELQLVLEM